MDDNPDISEYVIKLGRMLSRVKHLIRRGQMTDNEVQQALDTLTAISLVAEESRKSLRKPTP